MLDLQKVGEESEEFAEACYDLQKRYIIPDPARPA